MRWPCTVTHRGRSRCSTSELARDGRQPSFQSDALSVRFRSYAAGVCHRTSLCKKSGETPVFLFSATAFLTGAVIIAVTMQALRRARALADSHAANLELLNSDVNRSAERPTG